MRLRLLPQLYSATGNRLPSRIHKFTEPARIDFNEEGETFDCGPLGKGSQLYGGWFYFVGALIEAGNRAETERAAFESGFRYWFSKSFPRPPCCFGKNVSAIEFVTQVPWGFEERPS